MIKQKKYSGITVPVLTPVLENETVDEQGYRTLIKYLLDNGVHGVFACGTLGETMALTQEERDRAIRIAADACQGKAKVFAAIWEREALDGDHYRLAFDQEGSWSLKYNMVWDKLLELKLFSQQVYDLELAWYKQQMNEYGMPLDNRGETTKTDWQMWTTRLFDDPQYTHLIVDTMWKYLCQTPDRVPFSDCNFTTQPYTRIFIARTVQGGLFINLLELM